MEIEIRITHDVLNLPERLVEDVGGIVRFTGVVRGQEKEKTIEGLEYEAYQPMAENQMRKILKELSALHAIRFARILHRIGFVCAGEASIIVEIQAAHRKEAFAVAEKFMDRLKEDVPIWKSGVRWK